MQERINRQKAMHCLSDEDLFVAYREGDAAALEILVDRIKAPLFRTILRNVGDRFLAEDILQETVERIIRHRRRFDPSKTFRGWVWRIAINRSFDHLRRRWREVADDDLHREPSREADPEHQASNREIAGKITKAVQALPPEQRDVFLMREEAGMSFAEIAKTIDAPIGTVLSRMHYALTKLRVTIGESR